MKYEVRCCCEAEKLLGWLDVVHESSWRTELHIALLTPASVLDATWPANARGNAIRADHVVLPIAHINIPGKVPYRAIKADGLPIETLRRVPGFRENSDNPRYKSIDDLYIAIARYRRAHDKQLPPEPLNFTRAQWDHFLLERKSMLVIAEADVKGDRTIYGLRAERHRDLEELHERAGEAIESFPELWPEQWKAA